MGCLNHNNISPYTHTTSIARKIKKGQEASRVLKQTASSSHPFGTACCQFQGDTGTDKPATIAVVWLCSAEQSLSSDNRIYSALSEGTRPGSDLQTRAVSPPATPTTRAESSRIDCTALLTSICATLQRIFFLMKTVLLKLQKEHASFQNDSFL